VKIWLRLYGFEPCSWTSVFEYLGAAFDNIGVEVADFTQPSNPEECIELWWGDPQFWRWSDLPVKARVALALSEARSILKDGRQNVVSNLRKSDLIICPSESATLAFREAPIDVPIRVAYFGADSKEFPLIERDWDAPLTFLHAGVTQFRKGSWLVPEAFIAAFEPDDNVRLIMTAPRTSPMFTKLKGEFGKHPNIDFHNSRVETMMSFCEQSHVYVSPHLSEGFGLMPLEAMATGMPCIMSRCSAPREYFDTKFGYWVEMSEDYVPIFQCLPDTAGFWRLPDLQSLVKAMQQAELNREELAAKGLAASRYVSEEMTWEMTATRIVLHIKEMLDEKNIGGDVSIQRREPIAGSSEEHLAAC